MSVESQLPGRCVLIAIPVLLLGGTEIQTLSLVKALISGGFKVTVVCYHEYDHSIVDRFEAAGAKVLLMRYERTKGLWQLAKGLMKVYRDRKPDIVHVQYIAPGLIPIVAAKLAGIKTIYATVHIAGRIAYGLKAKILLRLASSLCTAFFCVSKGVEEFWFGSSELFDSMTADKKRKHFTIYNAVDTVKIAQIVAQANSEGLRGLLDIKGKSVVGIVGRLARQKGHAILLDALPEVIKGFPNVALLVIGIGPEEKVLRQQAQALGLEDHIIWLGEKRQEEVFQLYGIMDILVMPSLYEGFGLTATEAMAAGLPVVGTSVDGLCEIIKDNVTGYVVPAGNASELARAILKLLGDDDLSRRMGVAGRQRVAELFSCKKFGESWLGAYRGLSSH